MKYRSKHRTFNFIDSQINPEYMKNKTLEKFDKKFVSPKTLWVQDEDGKWYGKEDIRRFTEKELQAQKEEHDKYINELVLQHNSVINREKKNTS